MKLEKVTEGSKATTKRWYDDACGTALAMELVGERWALLIVRELMFGARRFGELKASLTGISANVLTQRLEGLEKAHILKRRRLPPPASSCELSLRAAPTASSSLRAARRSASESEGSSRTAISTTSTECCATEKACGPRVWPFQRATRASPCAMSLISTSKGEGSARSSLRPDSMRCQTRGGRAAALTPRPRLRHWPASRNARRRGA